ncbi:MAG: DUF1800 domain-containing protein [Bacteroidota bacterium]
MIAQQDQIKHLYNRAGFGLSPQEWHKRRRWSRQQAVEELFTTAQSDSVMSTQALMADYSKEELEMMDKSTKKALRRESKKLVMRQNAEWIDRMASPERSALREKMCLFWHGHFACITRGPKLAFRQLATIRSHALGNFRDFVLAIARDVSMIRFLNNQQNRKRKPNENFARELMELFTIGRGNYTEQDIKEAARAFTGWSSNLSGDFVFRRRQHDFGKKTFMGKQGNFDGEDIINILLERRETATFICRKIYRYFINEQVEEYRLKQLSDYFYDSNYDIKALMRRIFESDWFYDKANVGVRIKSPTELIAGIMRQLNARLNSNLTLRFLQKALGQQLFNPPNVAGWPGGQSWIDNSTLMLRLVLVDYLFHATDVNFTVKPEFEAQKPNKAIRRIDAHLDLQPMIATFGQHNQQAIYNELKAYLIAPSLKANKSLFDQFIIKNTTEDYIKSLTLRLMSMPEYQLC